MNKFDEVYLKIIMEDLGYLINTDNNVNLSIKNNDLVNDLTANDNKNNIESLIPLLQNFKFGKIYKMFCNFNIRLTDENGYLMPYAIDNGMEEIHFAREINLGLTTYNDISYKKYIKDKVKHNNYQIDELNFKSYSNNSLKLNINYSPADPTAISSGSYSLIFNNVKNNISYDELCNKFKNAFKTPYSFNESDIEINTLKNAENKDLIYEAYDSNGEYYNQDYGWGDGTFHWTKEDEEARKRLWAPIRKKEKKLKADADKKIKSIGNKFEKNLFMNIIFCKYNSKKFDFFEEKLADAAIKWFNEQIKNN